MPDLLRIVIRITVFLFAAQGLLCLRNVHLIVPESAEREAKVELKCLYELEKEVLYQVKWYRGDREFSRYAPRDVPPLKIFDIPGIEVIKKETNAKKLTIIPLYRETAEGKYTCEVTADTPSFQTAQVHTFMYVVDLPKSGPSMHGLKRRYKPGLTLKVECISRDSLPAANLSFFVNNERAHSQHVLHRVDGKSPGGLMTAYSTIQFVVQKQHFVRGKLKIRCTAIIYNIYSQSLEKSTDEERVRTTPSSVTETHEAIVYSIHRSPPPNSVVRYSRPSTSSRVFSLITLLLPTVLR